MSARVYVCNVYMYIYIYREKCILHDCHIHARTHTHNHLEIIDIHLLQSTYFNQSKYEVSVRMIRTEWHRGISNILFKADMYILSLIRDITLYLYKVVLLVIILALITSKTLS